MNKISNILQYSWTAWIEIKLFHWFITSTRLVGMGSATSICWPIKYQTENHHTTTWKNTMSQNIVTYKNTVPWPLYMCTVRDWTLYAECNNLIPCIWCNLCLYTEFTEQCPLVWCFVGSQCNHWWEKCNKTPCSFNIITALFKIWTQYI